MRRRLPAEIAVLAAAIVAALAVRAFVAAIYVIPSGSMLPGLMAGDYVIVEKWPYGWSAFSLPFGIGRRSARIDARLPRRGDIVAFRAPPAERATYVKRVIGLPGDLVALRGGVVILNGRPLPRARIGDGPPRFAERLPGGPAYATIDLGATVADDYGPARVPPGRLFVLGDNRDRSADSRFAAGAGGGVGMVPADDLVGRVALVIASIDGGARLADPGGWAAAVRWRRIGLAP